MNLIVKIIFVIVALRIAPLMTLGVACMYANMGWFGNFIGTILFIGGIMHMIAKISD
jgi:hypothetical protein